MTWPEFADLSHQVHRTQEIEGGRTDDNFL